MSSELHDRLVADETRADETRAEESRIGETRLATDEDRRAAEIADPRRTTEEDPRTDNDVRTDAADPELDRSRGDYATSGRTSSDLRRGPEGEVAAQAGTDVDDAETRAASLFSNEDGDQLRTQWDAVQTAFVDDPRVAVERADHLVVDIIETLSTSFSRERSQLEKQWANGESVSTEDLRLALQRYRTFFDRLLSI